MRKTNRCVIVEEGWPHGGVGANLAALVQEQAFDWLDAPVGRVTGADLPMPYSKPLEELAYPARAADRPGRPGHAEGRLAVGDVVMPRLSDSMEEGTILKWLVDPGAEVRRGQELVEIETDKATMTYEADAAGVLEIVAAEGDTLPIGAVIARIGATGAGASNGSSATPVGEEARPRDESDRPAPAASSAAPAPVPAPSAAPAPPSTERTKASPLARRIAREQHVDITALTGTGPGGRIVRADVEAARVAPPPASAPKPPEPAPVPAPAPAPAETGTAKGDVTRVELTRTQQLIARRMAESKATVPEFTLTSDVDMDRRGGAARAGQGARSRGDALLQRPRHSAPARWPCASSPAPTAPTATDASSSTAGSTSAWRWRRRTRSSSPPSSTPTPAA